LYFFHFFLHFYVHHFETGTGVCDWKKKSSRWLGGHTSCDHVEDAEEIAAAAAATAQLRPDEKV
jgi:hypothetical protein